eukprot:c5484_g1_i2.p1 GENE.c5484_g1_i2~~c5484_g1_i2.p1  ORF type:complete len:149 (+),score=12.81 c5484_g1_i2:50-496(+)
MRRRVYEILQAPLEKFLQQCEQSHYQGSGPGGQHRNRVKTGVRLHHRDFPHLFAEECNSRIGHENLLGAVDKLKIGIATSVTKPSSSDAEVTERIGEEKLPFPGTNGRVNPSNPLYPVFIAQVMDLLVTHHAELKVNKHISFFLSTHD